MGIKRNGIDYGLYLNGKHMGAYQNGVKMYPADLAAYFLAVGHNTTPFITIYRHSGDTFTKLANPAALPAGQGNGVAFFPNG